MTLPNHHLWKRIQEEAEDNIYYQIYLDLIREEIESGRLCPLCLCRKPNLEALNRFCDDCIERFKDKYSLQKQGGKGSDDTPF